MSYIIVPYYSGNDKAGIISNGVPVKYMENTDASKGYMYSVRTNTTSLVKYAMYGSVSGPYENEVFACLAPSNGTIALSTFYGEGASESIYDEDINGSIMLGENIIYYSLESVGARYPVDGAGYPTLEDALNAMNDGVWDNIRYYPITYRPTNCSFPGALTEAAVGDTVVVPVTFPEGYGLANPNDLFVQCNGVLVPSTYENGQLTFTMPDPS